MFSVHALLPPRAHKADGIPGNEKYVCQGSCWPFSKVIAPFFLPVYPLVFKLYFIILQQHIFQNLFVSKEMGCSVHLSHFWSKIQRWLGHLSWLQASSPESRASKRLGQLPGDFFVSHGEYGSSEFPSTHLLYLTCSYLKSEPMLQKSTCHWPNLLMIMSNRAEELNNTDRVVCFFDKVNYSSICLWGPIG